MSKINAFLKEIPQTSPTPLPCCNATRSLQLRKGPSSNQMLAPDLRLTASRIMRNKFILFISYPIYGIFLKQHVHVVRACELMHT